VRNSGERRVGKV